MYTYGVRDLNARFKVQIKELTEKSKKCKREVREKSK